MSRQIGNSEYYRINTIGDGSCLIHAICNALSKEYNQSNDKMDIAKKVRCEMAKDLCEHSDLDIRYISFKLNMSHIEKLAVLFFFKVDGTPDLITCQQIEERFKNTGAISEKIFNAISSLMNLYDKEGNHYTHEEIEEIMIYDPREYQHILFPQFTPDILQMDFPLTLNYFAYSRFLADRRETTLENVISCALDYNYWLTEEDLLQFIPDILGVTIAVIKENYTKIPVYYPTEKNERDVAIIIYNDREIHWETVSKNDNDSFISVFTNEMIENMVNKFKGRVVG